MVRRLTRDEMIRLVDNILAPEGRGFSSEEINEQLDLVCINSPDPAAALDMIIETPPPVTAAQLVERALACPPRDVRSLSGSELALDHPLRRLALDPPQ